MATRKEERSIRITIAVPGEYYWAMLNLEAWLKGRPIATEAPNLLGSILRNRTEERNNMLDFLAKGRGIGREELIHKILNGTVQPQKLEDWVNPQPIYSEGLLIVPSINQS